MSLSPTVKHTGQELAGDLCEIFKFWSCLQSKSVNNVCKLFQLRGDLVSRPPTETSPLENFRPPNLLGIAQNENSWCRHCILVWIVKIENEIKTKNKQILFEK